MLRMILGKVKAQRLEGRYPEVAVEIVTSKKEAADPASALSSSRTRACTLRWPVQLDSLGMPPRARDLRQSLARGV